MSQENSQKHTLSIIKPNGSWMLVYPLEIDKLPFTLACSPDSCFAVCQVVKTGSVPVDETPLKQPVQEGDYVFVDFNHGAVIENIESEEIDAILVKQDAILAVINDLDMTTMQSKNAQIMKEAIERRKQEDFLGSSMDYALNSGLPFSENQDQVLQAIDLMKKNIGRCQCYNCKLIRSGIEKLESQN